jgi:hypothetical protein
MHTSPRWISRAPTRPTVDLHTGSVADSSSIRAILVLLPLGGSRRTVPRSRGTEGIRGQVLARPGTSGAVFFVRAWHEYFGNVTASDEALMVDLADGRTITVPLVWFPRLAHGTPAERSKWRLIGSGTGIQRMTQASLRRWLQARRASSRRPHTPEVQSDAVDHCEVFSILGNQRHTAFERSCSDQRIKGPETMRLRIGLEEVVCPRADAAVDVHDRIRCNKTVDGGDIAFVRGADDQLLGRDEGRPLISELPSGVVPELVDVADAILDVRAIGPYPVEWKILAGASAGRGLLLRR